MNNKGRHSVAHLSFLVSLLAALSACVPNHYQETVAPVSLLKQSAAQIKSASVVIGLDPNNTQNFITMPYAGGANQGGLIGYLVTTAISSSMNDDLQQRASLMSPIKNAAIEFNFGSQYRQSIENNFKKLSWCNLNSVMKTPSFQRFSREALQYQYKDDAIIVSDVFYKMAEDFSKITFTSYVTIFPNNPALNQLVKKAQPDREHGVLYQKMFTTDYTLPGVSTEINDNAASWARNNSALVHQALQTGIEKLSTLISNDLSVL